MQKFVIKAGITGYLSPRVKTSTRIVCRPDLLRQMTFRRLVFAIWRYLIVDIWTDPSYDK